MSEAAEILNKIVALGLRYEVKAGQLVVGPGEKITDDLREVLRDRTPDLIAHLALKTLKSRGGLPSS